MKKILSNPLNVYVIIILIVSICAWLILIISNLPKTLTIEEFLEDKVCCECGKKATEHVNMVMFYCDYCYDKKYGDVPYVEISP